MAGGSFNSKELSSCPSPRRRKIGIAVDQLKEGLKALEKKDVDVMTGLVGGQLEPPLVARLLGGAFTPEKQEHQVIALGLAGVLAPASGGRWRRLLVPEPRVDRRALRSASRTRSSSSRLSER